MRETHFYLLPATELLLDIFMIAVTRSVNKQKLVLAVGCVRETPAVRVIDFLALLRVGGTETAGWGVGGLHYTFKKNLVKPSL